MIPIDPLHCLWIALFALFVALINSLLTYKPKSKVHYKIDEVTFHDGAVKYYLMQRAAFGKWKLLQIQGPRAFDSLAEAQQAIEEYLFNELDYELSETVTVKEYGE